MTIAAVERDTGLSKDVLRVWERRYGFPAPERDAHGERVYPWPQVERLRLVKRLLEQGHRPGRLLTLPAAELAALARPPAGVRAGADRAAEAVEAALDDMLALLQQHHVSALRAALQQRLARQGLLGFVQDTVAPLAARVGRAWEHGELQVFEEHLCTELVQRLLRQAIHALPPGTAPRIVLTTLPPEPHVLGLLMAEAAFALEGAYCVPLGTQMPLPDIAAAAAAHAADVVALSFSGAYPRGQVAPALEQLRAALPPATALWVGGAGVERAPLLEGVQRMAGLDAGVRAVRAWRVADASAPVPPG
jgi:MerR family transcriptional regulator, light-induced transcriptional regulator